MLLKILMSWLLVTGISWVAGMLLEAFDIPIPKAFIVFLGFLVVVTPFLLAGMGLYFIWS